MIVDGYYTIENIEETPVDGKRNESVNPIPTPEEINEVDKTENEVNIPISKRLLDVVVKQNISKGESLRIDGAVYTILTIDGYDYIVSHRGGMCRLFVRRSGNYVIKDVRIVKGESLRIDGSIYTILIVDDIKYLVSHRGGIIKLFVPLNR
jgi:hypothetical protein